MDTVKLKYDIFPKSKYRLYINGFKHYYFVTTRHNEEDSIGFMMEKVKDYYSINKTSYKIVKVENEKEIILKRGTLK